jgi:hypothetical protein
MRRDSLLKRLHASSGWPVAAGVLVLALLFAQTLGLLHGIAHGQHTAGEQAIQEPHRSVAALFDAHEGKSTECKLYDQLTHGDLLPFAIVAFASPAPLSARIDPAAHACYAAAPGWFLARGPPQRD